MQNNTSESIMEILEDYKFKYSRNQGDYFIGMTNAYDEMIDVIKRGVCSECERVLDDRGKCHECLNNEFLNNEYDAGCDKE